MSQTAFRSKNLLVGLLIVATLLITSQAWVRSPDLAPVQASSVENQPVGALLNLEVMFTGNTLIGTVTIFDKDDRPWTCMRGHAYLLDSSGQQLAVVPLQPLAPGEFRLNTPLGQLNAPGYLDVRVPGCGRADERRGIYQIDRDQQTATRVEAIPNAQAPLAPQATGGPDDFGYTWDDTATYNWINTSGGTPVTTLRDDDWVGPFDIGFTFNFYGQNYTQFYLDSNGYIGFDNVQTASYYTYSKTSLPHASRPNNLIAPFWSDLDPSQGGTVRYQTFGTWPNRYLVVEWNAVPLYYSPSDAQSFEVILYEISDDIKFQYPDTRQGLYGDLYYATAGIENVDGTIGLVYPYTIPTYVTRAIQFYHNQADYNVFLTPERQGSSSAAGEAASLRLTVRNLGSNSDSFTLSRYAYTGSNWSVSFYEANGTTPLSGNNTGTIAAGSEKEIVVKVHVPGGSAVGDWTRVTIRATSQGNPSEYDEVVFDATAGTSFAQVYTDNESDDGTDDSENYFEAIEEGDRYTRRVTTDQDNSSYAGVATTPDDDVVNMWNTTYYNGNAWVSEIGYAILNRYGSLIHPVTRLTDNSAATQETKDFSPALDVAPNGNVAIGWARQVDTTGDGELDRRNAWYAIVSSSGSVVKSPTALTFNPGGGYPRDYPPSATALSGGRFLLAWEHATKPSSDVYLDVYYTVLNNNGTVAVPTTNLTDEGAGRDYTPRVAALPDGGAAIVWTGDNDDGYSEIFYRTVDSNGTRTNPRTSITSNGNSGAESRYADVIALSDGQIAVAWTQYAGGGDQDIQYTIVGSEPPPPEGIHGQVTYQGSPIAGIYLVLRFYDGSSWSTALTTVTQADGTYQFTGAPSLTAGQRYYVRYNNGSDGNTDSPNYLWYYRSFYLNSYTAGTSVAGGDFDIVNVALVAPANGATVPLPCTFQWTPRGISTDHYRVWLYCSADSNWYYGSDVGTAGSWTLTSLGSISCAGQWYWFVRAHPTGDLNFYDLGFGESYEWRAINFSSLGASASEGTNTALTLLDSPVEDPSHRLQQNDDPSTNESTLSSLTFHPAAPAQTIHTVPNDLSDYNIYVSLTRDEDNNLIMTWLDNYGAEHLFYALADQNGDILTPATIFQRTRRSYLWSSWNGYGNDMLPPSSGIPSPNPIYVPIVIRNYPPPPPPPPVDNGDFELGNLSGWTRGGDAPGLNPRAVTSQRHSGSYAAVLGQEGAPCQTGQGGLVGRSWIYQDVTVPDMGSPQLELYYRIHTYDKVNADKYDRFEIYIDGTLLGRFGNTSANYGCSKPINYLDWQPFTYDLSAYRGQTIRLRLVNVTHPDDWYGTWTYVDDVEIIP